MRVVVEILRYLKGKSCLIFVFLFSILHHANAQEKSKVQLKGSANAQLRYYAITKGKTTRTPFVAKALQDFGFWTEDREGGTEESKLLLVLRKPHAREGERLHVHPIISPALLVYNLIRANDASDSLWRRAAIDLARSHGLIPVPQTRNYHLKEVEHINQWLERLLRGAVSSVEFRAEIRGMS